MFSSAYRNRLPRSLTVAVLPWALALFGACGGSEVPAESMELAPPPDGQGVQYRMTSTIAPGQEIERCMFVQAPAEGLYINHQEVRYTPGSHHVLLYLTPYFSIPTKDTHDKVRDTSGVMDCPEGATADWQVSGVLGGAQSTHGGSLVSLPPGVAVQVPGNAIMLINTHYLNAGTKELVADARINIYTIPEAEVKQEAGVLFFYNPVIRVPAQGKSSARMRCKASKDITITNMQSHMHRRAVNYVADLLDGNAQKLETLYTNTNWEEVPVGDFGAGKQVKAGQYLDYRCDYDNPESRVVLQGPSTRDEMCMLIGSYYPRDDETAYCMDGTVLGSGQKACAETYKCSTDAIEKNDTDGFYQCILNSCPAVGARYNDAIRCYFRRGGNACAADCKDPKAPTCGDCVNRECKTTFDACQMATCG